MFSNYLKVAFRNIGRHKGHAFINIAGLAVGLASCLLILLWVGDELSFDRFNENADDIYRVLQDIRFSDHETTWAIAQGPLGPSLENDIPEILRAARVTWRGMQLRSGETRFDETVGMADGSIFEMFTFPLIAGDAASVLSNPFSIVLSEEMTRKYFPGEDPLGKTVHADDKFDFLVTGIMKDIPRNSHLQFDFLVPFIFGRELNYTVDRWDNSQFRTYVQLRPSATAAEVIAKISGYLEDKPTIEKDAKLTLQPLKRIYLHSNYEFDMALGDIRSVHIFSLVAFFILLIACINFMNLSTARSLNRAREVGMRKVSGANRGHIIGQFYGESALLTGISLAVGLALTAALLRPFNNLAAKDLSLSVLGDPQPLLGLAAIAVLTGIIAGSYPALFLSSFGPVRVLKGSPASGTKGAAFRKILVVVQFTLSVMLIISTIFISRQLTFMREYKLGYDKEHLVSMRLRGDMGEKYEAIKAELLRIPDVSGVTVCSNIPTYGYMFSNSLWKWEGQGPDEEILMRALTVGEDYFEVFGMEILQGRSFGREPDPEKTPVFIVNEQAANVMGLKEPVGQWLSVSGLPQGTIVGVVKDYNFTPLNQKIDPLIIIYHPPSAGILTVKLSGNNMARTMASIEEVWKTFAPIYPFRYRFLDEALDALYRSEQRTGTIFHSFSFLAIFVSCLGLFGLSSFLAEKRTREIGIRKVLGATAGGIVFLFSREFTKWVAFSNVFAWPVAYFAARKWLDGYAYRISVGVWPFLMAGALAILIALATVSVHSLRASRINPAVAIRYE